MQNTQLHLIIGYGYLGRYLKQQLVSNKLCVTVRSQRALVELKEQGMDGHLFDINQPMSKELFDYLQRYSSIALYCLVPPSQIEVSQFKQYIKALTELPIQRALLTSSTVVYGEAERVVDADSDAAPETDRALRQFAIEQQWLALGDNFYVVRLAGLYGKDRIIGARQLHNQQALSGDPDTCLNLIHAEDAAALLQVITDSKTANRIELGCDGTPVKRSEYYAWLSQKLKTKAPLFESRQTASKRSCSNTATVNRVQWQPKYKNYRHGIEASLN